jgi:hypothetical protein
MIGSHLDTVPNSGAFDGILGVMMGLALVEALEGERLPFAIELVGFSEEEGVRYSLPFIGSRAVVGRIGCGTAGHQGRRRNFHRARADIVRTGSFENWSASWATMCRLPRVPHRAGRAAGKRRYVAWA